MRTDKWLPRVKERWEGSRYGHKRAMWDPCGDRNALHLVRTNIDILVVIFCHSFGGNGVKYTHNLSV